MRLILKIFRRIKNTYTYSNYMYRRTGNCEYLNDFYRNRLGIRIGKNCKIYSRLVSPEAYLISIGDDVTISTNVHLINHDNSVCKVLPEFTDVFGRITIGNNCFIGANSIILPGVTLGANTIVAAGSVVTKSFEGNVVIGGNPARIITDISTYREKVKPFAINTDGKSRTEKKDLLLKTEKLIKK